MSTKTKAIRPQTIEEFLRPHLRINKLSVRALANEAVIDNSYLHKVLKGIVPIGMGASIRLCETLEIPLDAIAIVQVRRQIFDFRQAAKKANGHPSKVDGKKPVRDMRCLRRSRRYSKREIV